MFIDKIKITVKSGNGGNGAATFHREKYVPNGGPDGGDGGNGGAIIFECDDKKNNLIDFHFKKKFTAPAGENGTGRRCNGKCGEDLVIKVPVGTIIRDAESGRIIADMFYDGEKKTVLSGGRGGKGNMHFATSTRQAPAFSQNGEITPIRTLILELKTIADVGFVGMPNAGKSTLLSVISAAKPKIADYHFTTLSPNLGVVKYHDDSFVAADIPGLIEGAADGAGLGHSFLRHIERTRMLVHVVDMSGIEGDPVENYNMIVCELRSYSAAIADKPTIVACNKMDCEDSAEHLKRFRHEVKGVDIVEISALNHTGLDKLIGMIISKLADIPKLAPEKTDNFEYVRENVTEYEIKNVQKGVFEITGAFVRYLGRNVNLDDIDSFNYFQRMLRDNNVIARLREMGIEEGDLVLFGDVEFEFID